jgi:hypothetical protein
LYKWSNLILRGKIPFLMSLGEDLGQRMPLDMGLPNDKLPKMDGIETAIHPYRASVKDRFF